MRTEQLLLELDWGREPWNGYSPRVLTTGYSVRINAKAARLEEIADRSDPAQLTFFLQGKSDGS